MFWHVVTCSGMCGSHCSSHGCVVYHTVVCYNRSNYGEGGGGGGGGFTVARLQVQ